MIEREPGQLNWPDHTLHSKILEAASKREVGLGRYVELPARIEIDSFISLVAECRGLTDQDGNERITNIDADPNADIVMIHPNFVLGDEWDVEGDYDNSSEGNAGRRFVGTLHSHPDNLPISIKDIADTLSKPATLLELLTTTEGTTMLVLTKDTLWIEPETRDAHVQHWISVLHKRLKSLRQSDPALSKLIDSSPEEFQKVDFALQHVFAQELAREAKFGYYRGGHSGALQRV